MEASRILLNIYYKSVLAKENDCKESLRAQEIAMHFVNTAKHNR